VVHVEGVLGHPIPAEQAGGEGIPDPPEADQPGLTRLRIAHAPQPVAHGIGIGARLMAEQRQEGFFTLQLSEIFEGPAAGLEQQDDRLDEDRGGVASVAARLRQVPIGQRPQAEGMGVLRQ
jgi:hypothetical protein